MYFIIDFSRRSGIAVSADIEYNIRFPRFVVMGYLRWKQTAVMPAPCRSAFYFNMSMTFFF